MLLQNILFLLLSYGICEQEHDFDDLVVKLNEGFVKGKWISTWGGKRVQAFLGIPYAKPPVAHLRFKDPEDVEPWDGIRSATEDGSSCVQYGGRKLVGQEDCLFLNVFIPDNARGNLPVLFYIHGGFLVAGSSNSKDLGPEILLDYGEIILVTINYRLSVLGFLSIDDEEARGNFGFKDQVAALRWTNRNIKHFGGNPNQVTLFGHSAGSTSVGYHLHSDMSKGLFHRAILSSSGMTSHRAVDPSFAKANTLLLAQYLNCPKSSNSTVIMKCLREASIEDIFNNLRHLRVWKNEPLLVFRPTLERGLGDGRFITEESVKSRSTVPLILGYVSEDGYVVTESLKSKPESIVELNKNFYELIPVILRYDQYKEKDKLTTAIKKFYLKNSDINEENYLDFTHMCGDVLYFRAILEELKQHDGPALVYYYTHRGTFSVLDDETLEGVAHGDQQLLIFPFQSSIEEEHRISERDRKASADSASLIVGFTKLGVSYPGWEDFDFCSMNYLHIGTNECTMKKNLLGPRSKFWNEWLNGHTHIEL